MRKETTTKPDHRHCDLCEKPVLAWFVCDLCHHVECVECHLATLDEPELIEHPCRWLQFKNKRFEL